MPHPSVIPSIAELSTSSDHIFRARRHATCFDVDFAALFEKCMSKPSAMSVRWHDPRTFGMERLEAYAQKPCTPETRNL